VVVEQALEVEEEEELKLVAVLPVELETLPPVVPAAAAAAALPVELQVVVLEEVAVAVVGRIIRARSSTSRRYRSGRTCPRRRRRSGPSVR